MRTPDLQGQGSAWRVTARGSTDSGATIDCWLVRGPWHPLWSFWLVSTIHLRDIPGQSKPAHKTFAAATHEFLIVSLQSAPSTPEVKPDPDDLETLRHLTPPDVAKQFVGTDAEAVELCRLAVNAILFSGASPD